MNSRSSHFNHGAVKYEYTSDGPVLRVVKEQDVEEIMRATKAIEKPKSKNMHYLGSVPNVIALQWALESGTRIYSKEWLEYAKKKLLSPEFKYLRAGHN